MVDEGSESASTSGEPPASVLGYAGLVTDRGDRILRRLRQTLLEEGASSATFERRLEDTSLAVLGEGQARLILHEPTTDRVVKLEKHETPYQNRTEAELWLRELDETGRDRFAPVVDVATDFGYLIQAKVDSVGLSKADRINLIEVITLEHGIALRDLDPDNYGVLDGSPVVFDYGTARPVAESDRWDSRQDAYESTTARIERRTEE